MGGIVSVIKNIEESCIKEDFEMVRIETYISGGPLIKLKLFIKAWIRFLLVALSKHPDLIHIHMSEKGSFYRKTVFLFMSKLVRIPVILHLHGATFDAFYKSNKLQGLLCKFVLNKADRLIVLSQEWRKYYAQIVPSEKVKVLYNGVATTRSKISNLKPVKDEPVCLFLGRLGQRKGTYDLLEAIIKIKELDIAAKFVLAGDGEIDEVSRFVKVKGIQDIVSILGWVGASRKEELLLEADILVLPSYHEGLPMAILEAMNYSLPIVSTRVGGIPEVIMEGKNGYLINPGDVGALTVALHRLIQNKSLREEMGEENRSLISQFFNMDILAKDLKRIYLEVLK